MPILESITTEVFLPGLYLEKKDLEEIGARMRPLAESYFSAEICHELICTEHCAHIIRLLLKQLPIRLMSAEEISNADRRNGRLDRFMRYVEENHTEKPSLEEFAKMEHCSASYMSRFLKSNLDQSFNEYVNYVRFRHACRLIRSGTLRMIDVCESAGFSDYRYFSGSFKKYCGMTPEEYRLSRPAQRGGLLPRSSGASERFYTREESLGLLKGI